MEDATLEHSFSSSPHPPPTYEETTKEQDGDDGDVATPYGMSVSRHSATRSSTSTFVVTDFSLSIAFSTLLQKLCSILTDEATLIAVLLVVLFAFLLTSEV